MNKMEQSPNKSSYKRLGDAVIKVKIAAFCSQ